MQSELSCNNNRAFILQALKEGCRIDGRRQFDFRKFDCEIATDDSRVLLTLGNTRVVVCTAHSLEQPFPDRPQEGFLKFSVEFSRSASPAVESGSNRGWHNDLANEMQRMVEKTFRESRAVDLEALCVLSGRAVWSLMLDIRVLDHDGNALDAVCLAALVALLVFRKPEVTVGGSDKDDGDVTVHSADAKEPLPLTIHHLPLSVTFALFQGEGGECEPVVDPCLEEECAMTGSVTFVVNAHDEVCTIHKNSGMGMLAADVLRCMRLAIAQARDLTELVKKQLDAHAVRRVQARVRRHVEFGAICDDDAAAAAAAAAHTVEPPSNNAPEPPPNQWMDKSDDEMADDVAPSTTADNAQTNGSTAKHAAPHAASHSDATAGPSSKDTATGPKLLSASLSTTNKWKKSSGAHKRGGTDGTGSSSAQHRASPKLQRTAAPTDELAGYDNFASIAAVIAGGKTNDAQQPPSLQAAVKTSPSRRKAKPIKDAQS